MDACFSFARVSDTDLTIELKRLLGRERESTARLVACVAEFDARRLYLPMGFSSMFTYCRDHLHLGEGAAYRRIEAARASRRFPEILELVANGAITLTNLALVRQLLTERNHAALLAEISHKTKAETQAIVARIAPKPDAITMLRRLPAARSTRLLAPSTDSVAPVDDAHTRPRTAAPVLSARPVIAPLAPERFKLQITVNQQTYDRLRQVQDLMRHTIPSGDVGLIIERALTCLLQDLLRRKTGARKRDFRKEDDPRRPEPGGHMDLLH